MVRLDNITKVFSKGTIDEKVAIDGITLHIRKGDFVTIIGSNGAGKTTIFNIINALYPSKVRNMGDYLFTLGCQRCFSAIMISLI